MARRSSTPVAQRYGPAPGERWPSHAERYTLPPRTRRPRRSLGGALAGVLGMVAVILVLAVLGLAAFTDGGGVSARIRHNTARVSAETATANPLYRSGPLTPVGCRLPRIRQGADESMRRFMETLSQCLDRSWGRQFGKADLAFEPPKRIFWTSPGRGPCGSFPSPGAAAFYCPENNTMYVGLRHIVETSGGEPVSHYAVYARVIAHEYGHHVQERAGILAYGHQRMDSSSAAGRAETSRRIELQAQCLAGVFLGAERDTLPMTRTQYVALMIDVRGRGDDRQPVDKRDHGSGHNYAGWVEKGYKDRAVGACDTWTVPGGQVD